MSSSSPSRGHRLWFPFLVLVLAAGGFYVLNTSAELERNLKSWFSSGIVLISGVLLLLWFLLFSRFSLKLRVGIAGLVAVIAAALSQTVRVEGTVDGTGRPRFVWRWSERTAPQFRAQPSVPSVAQNPVDLISAPNGMLDTPQFFGPSRDGRMATSPWNRNWQAAPPKLLWRQPIGLGWSAFAVVGGRAVTQEQRGEDELVTCYEARTGALLWAHTNRTRFVQWQGGDGPRATPTVVSDQVFAYGGTGILDALDLKSGRLLWSRDVLKENALPNIIWGASASPLVFDNTVVVTGGMTNRATVLAYRKDTGAPLWQSGADKASYASPTLATFAGRRVVLSVNAASITLHDPTSGNVLLDHPWAKDNWPKSSQPVVLSGDRLFVSAGYGLGCMMLQIKVTQEGKWSATELWKNKMMKTQFNSPVERDGYLYGLDDGLLACVDLTTGQRKWKDGRYGSGQSMLAGDVILIQSEQGAVVLAAAVPNGFTEMGRIEALSSKTWNYPTLAGRFLLVRNDQEAACYELAAP